MFDSGELQAMSDEGLIDALRRAHGAAAFAQAAEVLAVRELYRRQQDAEEGTVGPRGGEFAATEAALAVQISEQVAAALIDIGLALDALPRTREAFASGRIDLARTQVIADNTREVPPEILADLEQTLIEAAVRSTPARLRQTARRWVAKLDPEGERRRRERREQDRDIRIKAVQDGMAVFEGLLPAAGAQTVAMRLREMSRQVCEEDPRTMPQRRADALVALSDGSGRLPCSCGRGADCPVRAADASPRRPLIQIGIPAGTLLTGRDHPAFLAGYGPLDAGLARRIAEQAQFQVIPERTDDPSITEEALRREPPAWLDREIRALDGCCRFPGCTMPAAECEIDHIEPFDVARPGRGGPTVMANLITLCAHHRRLKSLADNGRLPWRVHRGEGDRLHWTSPTGDRHVTVREGARYLFPHTDTEAPDLDWPSPTAVSEPPHPATIDLTYPLEHALAHRPLSAVPPEDRP
ncbi:HNH endonuclease signature motif containing protein [Nocardia sp. BMG51109]|uniref:HNH endonuclease signature motif containing protein n=1 Tax=Nocardia sp. BMG51109 TaxID=1056816 RepID=UPI0004664E68|nr:HNH endonuclease signature motif containing protein [Nocardia sp. BMG51109]